MQQAKDENYTTSISYERIFKELSKLEKDFRHQETQLKLKIEDYEKCTVRNTTLKEYLDEACHEIEHLRKQIEELKQKNGELEDTNREDKDQCDQVIKKLTTKISLMNNEHKNALDNCQLLLEQTKNELAIEREQAVKEAHAQHREELVQLHCQIEHESDHANQLKSKLDFALEDNLLLQDKFRQLQQQFSALDACKGQLASTTIANEKLKSQLMQSKNETQTLTSENVLFKKNNMQLNAVICTLNEQKRKCNIELTEKQALLLNTQSQLNATIAKCNKLTEANNNFKNENLLLLKRIEKYHKDHCNVDAHRNVVKQNTILQELVKEMRRQRQNGTGDQQVQMTITEERLERLENLIYELRSVLLTDKPNAW